VNTKLPIANNAEDKKKRQDMFKKFDPNGSGSLNLTEVLNGM
jgi:hypothetical protein